MRVLVALALLALPALALAQDHETIRTAEVRAGAGLFCVDRKCGTKEQVGLWLRDREGKCTKVWEGEPYDARLLPDGRVLVAERWKGRVVMLDRQRKVVFEKSGFDEPVDVEMDRDGSIVVVAKGSGEVVGLDPATGAVRWRRAGFTTPFDVECLPDGGLLVADSGAGRVVELDRSGDVRRVVGGLGFPNTVEKLANGGFLTTTWSGGEVVEVDANGKIVCRWNVGGTVYRAVRRADGTTLVALGEGKLIVLSSTGVAIRTETFSPGCVDWEPIDEV